MEKIKIKLIILGNSDSLFSVKKIVKHKSFLFEIIHEPEYKYNLPKPEHPMNNYGQTYLDTQLKKIIGQGKSDIIQIAIINCELEDNFYIRRIYRNTAVLSISFALQYLPNNDITIDNFILKNIYHISMAAFETNQNLLSDGIIDLHHIDSRKCLYDMNGDLYTIIYNTERPIICSECENRLHNLTIPKNFIKKLKKELLGIDKSQILKFELLIKKYPLISVLIVFITSVFINILSNILYKIIENNTLCK